MGASRDCPQCKQSYPWDTVLCVECGINLLSGEQMQYQVGSPNDVDDDNVIEPSLRFQILQAVAYVAPGLFRPLVLITSIIAAALGLFITGFAVFVVIVFMAALGAFAIGAAGMGLYAHAIAWVLSGEIEILTAALADFDERQWTTFFLLLFAPGLLVAIAYQFGAFASL